MKVRPSAGALDYAERLSPRLASAWCGRRLRSVLILSIRCRSGRRQLLSCSDSRFYEAMRRAPEVIVAAQGAVRVGLRILTPETVNRLYGRQLQRGELSCAARGRAPCERDGWRNPRGEQCAASARKALARLAPSCGSSCRQRSRARLAVVSGSAGTRCCWRGRHSPAAWKSWARSACGWPTAVRSGNCARLCWRRPIRWAGTCAKLSADIPAGGG